ncbi:asparagine synthase (glutamine-hydrolyzing) [Erythrobacter sp. T5W1-R]|uniref:asparagine synthase (glutamine-hydrolyzing) n=1 Tax=Erythrobacter sp. T5W1-R TaxID=3101752 RepID=UPI002AFEC4F1|nr:asparagine synthase (glutamine-hydrolyzing) [Erythrobacter sp. T5W1-R]MEA1618177.1 asparagine synthase (glutamine-hydrolyzing) [Erythrobacter sp. T5W1-R]
MCGLAGFMSRSFPDPERRLIAMTDAIIHRGPDSSGHWVDANAGVALGHRRLSIVDLSSAGHQPMTSASGRYVFVFNGEIYNHLDLRADLEAAGFAPAWRGLSDTETLIAGFDAWGVTTTIGRAIGMFAFAVWDRQNRKLILGRDRIGEKPLYYGWQGEGEQATFLFGSELRALRAHPVCGSEIDRGAVAQFMRHGHVGESNAIYKGLHKLPPGCLAELSLDKPEPAVTQYWSAVEALRPTAADIDPSTAVDELDALLRDAVARQMVADVPLGAFLSGGVDSSLVVGLMQAQSARPVRTFSIGFNEPRYNEAEFAKQVATHLGTQHTELYVGDAELRDVVPILPHIYTEPFADSSQIPTFLVSKLARESVTVALSGDGGDELFGGYDRYRQGASFMQRLRYVPAPLRPAIAAAVKTLPTSMLDTVLAPFLAVPAGKEPNGQRMHRLADYAASRSVDELHRKMVSRWPRPCDVVIGGAEPQSLLGSLLPPSRSEGDAARMMLLDVLTYLPDDILAKVDRASMRVSLECRAPFLDHRVVEFAGRLPQDLKLREGKSKWALRQVLYRYVPAALIERPKMGFEVPVGIWLRGPLKDWAQALLDPERLDREGFLNSRLLTEKWAEHLSERFNWGPQLWNALMFLAWLESER